MSDFIPRKISDSLATMLVEIDTCPICQKTMVFRPTGHSPFPRHHSSTFESQIKHADWVIRSDVQVDEQHICETCKREGKATFECVLCKERRSTSLVKESFGDSPDYLCTVCFESVRANKWAKAVEELEKAHRYDFE